MVCGRDSLVHVFDVGTMELSCVMDGHDTEVHRCNLSSTINCTISGDSSGKVLLWLRDEGDPYGPTLRMQVRVQLGGKRGGRGLQWLLSREARGGGFVGGQLRRGAGVAERISSG